MNFNSPVYWAFLAGCIVTYYLLPHRLRNPFLLCTSYFFYMCWNPKYALLMLFSTAVTYFCGVLVDRSAEKNRKKLWLVLSLLVNLAILFFFKYFNFTVDLLNRGFAFLGLGISAPTLNVLLPVGISFYTFQALGYTIDVYRGDIAAEKSFVNYALFVSFFPQLVAGPIERSGNILHQLREEHRFQFENIRDGVLPVLWGLTKKILLADNLAVIVNAVYNAPQSRTGAELWLATAAFAVQIYCDFSAYSDIARGSAKMLGFTLMENFRCPYLAESIPDFWRRWHISLSTWFQDYLYFPLGGSRCKKWRHLLNLLIVFLVSGLWHGAALTFVAWGLLNGVYQVLSVLTRNLRKRLREKLPLQENSVILRAWRILVTFVLTCLAWVLFRANTLTDALAAFAKMLSPLSWGGVHLSAIGTNRSVAVLLTLCSLSLLFLDPLITHKKLAQRINQTTALRYLVYFVLIALMLLFGSYGTGYAPQEFVYFQF